MTPARAGSSGRVRARTGCRVDLAGGTLDIWPLGLLHPGASTVNVAVEVPVTVELAAAPHCVVEVAGRRTVLPSWGERVEGSGVELLSLVAAELGAPPLEIRIESAAPRGSGLGASSSIVVALIAALDRLLGRSDREPAAVVELARDLEARLMQLPTGVQDHWPALLGGALALEHRPGRVEVHSLAVDLDVLERQLIVVHSGETHVSARQNWEVVRRRLDGDPDVVARLEAIRVAATEVRDALEKADWARLGVAMDREWRARRGLAPNLETPRLRQLTQAAADAGAWGSKVCGAGGGGCLAVLSPEALRPRVADALVRTGAAIVPTPLRRIGLSVEES